VLGFLSAQGGGWQATANLQLNVSDPNQLATVGANAQALATSESVLGIAAQSLRSGTFATQYKNAQGLNALPKKGTDDSAAIGYLASGVTAVWATNASLVTVTVTRADSQLAGIEANAIATAVVSKMRADADEDVTQAKSVASDLISNQTIGPSSAPAESARLQQVGNEAGTRMAAAAFAARQTVKVIPASKSFPAGQNKIISALLGAAGGAFLGALAAVAAGAGRRKPHSPRELMALAPDLTVRTTVQAGELAGRVMETGRRTVVVLAMPDTRFAATQLAMAIAHHLRTHGATVALVDRVSEFSPGAGAEDRLWALRRDVRRNIPANFAADLLVVVCGADEEALSLIAGQSDLLVAVVSKQRKATLADIRRTVDAVRVSEPVVVLAR